MTTDIHETDLERFRTAIAGRLGLHFDESKSGFLADVLRRRFDATRLKADEYLARLESWPPNEELGPLARELTVPETYFFRNADQYRALTELVLPERLAVRCATKRLQILSLGCASGEEAFSLAMVARDTIADPAWDISILGVDVNPAMIEKAARGRFSAWALREMPEHDRQRWFRPEGRDFVLDEVVRASVRFETRNLIDDDPRFWHDATWDVVFCRNVIMYFTPEQAQALLGRIARALCPGGYLFAGHAETLRGLSNDFHLRHTHGTFYYQRRDDKSRPLGRGPRPLSPDQVGAATAAAPPACGTSALPIPSLTAVVPDADTWVDAIRRASERVAALTESCREKRSPKRPHPDLIPRAWDLGLALELLRKERVVDALALIDRLPPESGRDPDVLLLRAVLLTHGGQLARAEDACRRLLEVDELSAGAHYLLALCREGVGDSADALYHDQVAAYLDPVFAMPRLHLGLLARRSGDPAAARRELGHALVLLQREDASRLLLFGGGFSREALVALVRTELLRCGGKA